MPVISRRSESSIRALRSLAAGVHRAGSVSLRRLSLWIVLWGIALKYRAKAWPRTDTSLSIPRPNPGRPLLRNIITNASSQVLMLLSIWLRPSVTVLKLISESAPYSSELVLLIPSKLISPLHTPFSPSSVVSSYRFPQPPSSLQNISFWSWYHR